MVRNLLAKKSKTLPFFLHFPLFLSLSLLILLFPVLHLSKPASWLVGRTIVVNINVLENVLCPATRFSDYPGRADETFRNFFGKWLLFGGVLRTVWTGSGTGV